MDYVQVPEERPEPADEAKEAIVEESTEVIKEKKKAELVKQMSLSTTDGGGNKNINNLFHNHSNDVCFTFQLWLNQDLNQAFPKRVTV